MEKKAARREELSETVPTIVEGLNKKAQDISNTETSLKATKAKLEEKAEQRDKQKGSLRFGSLGEAKKEVKALEKTIEAMKKAYEAALEELTKSGQRKAGFTASVEAHTRQLTSLPVLDEAAETEKEAMLTERQAENKAASETLFSRKQSNENARNGIRERSDQLAELEKRLAWMKALSATANGNVNGKEKVQLETYIQMTYFERIIARANTRFMKMSGGQYELKRRKVAENNNGDRGLDLNVVDHYNGTERSVKTLSGGESFMASLSLALGLSDEIQASAGGVKLDTMFVDEGFGSLDEETLDQAMKALSDLADGKRLVGIISHVSELKSRIDKQIVVTKEKSGGSRATIIV